MKSNNRLTSQQLGDLFKTVFKSADGKKLLRWMITNYGVFEQTPLDDHKALIAKNMILEFIGYINKDDSQSDKIYSYLEDN
jgi:hypothetical protein